MGTPHTGCFLEGRMVFEWPRCSGDTRNSRLLSVWAQPSITESIDASPTPSFPLSRAGPTDLSITAPIVPIRLSTQQVVQNEARCRESGRTQHGRRERRAPAERSGLRAIKQPACPLAGFRAPKYQDTPTPCKTWSPRGCDPRRAAKAGGTCPRAHLLRAMEREICGCLTTSPHFLPII
ncbi:uncharacterized protein LY79DRAFT_259310 [Colletotrichum navitas]|uniref:Uncharacterized protein n=1 Tax=Colletotrichum navitas TaxID=681940 RepID=A0AAD8V3I9_9PEZI|nr:uncharacterized protein LY79DRAFT_259310 [Colletotrichum navitas]KAK1585938.1 hypothetical protein LY79DRAFT_259310 [Colletotrichum navitas]